MSKWRNALYLSRPDSLLWRRSLLPTTGLYFLNVCEDLISDRASERMIEQIGANTFRTDHATLVIRQDLPEAVARALNDHRRRLVYLLDDHVAAHATDTSLPDNYRRRLGERWERMFLPLLRRAAVVVVCSDYLLHHLSAYGPTVRADPVWHPRLFQGLRQKLATPTAGERAQVAVLGTGSHQAELAFLVPVLLGLLTARPEIELTLPGGPSWPAALAGDPRVRLRWPVPWFEYEARLAAEHYDICLYPCLDAPFAAARSRNKLTEQALTGAFGLFSESWPHAGAVQMSGAGGLARNTPEEWQRAVLAALDALPAWRERAATTAAAIGSLNETAPQRALWQRLLGPEPSL